MKKSICVALILALLLLPSAAMAEGGDGGNLIYNADFSNYSEQAELPAGWELSAYYPDDASVKAGIYEDTTYGLCVGLTNLVDNDARICQDVFVEPDSVYRIAGRIRTDGVSGARGATISVDNYDIDGTYCFSKDVVGTAGWTDIEMYVRTAKKQTVLRIALRLGGYGTTSEGQAWFSGVSAEAYAGDAADIVDLATENGAGGTVSKGAATASDASERFTAMLITTALLLLLSAFLYLRYAQSESAAFFEDKDEQISLIALLFLAFGLRLICSLIFYGHSTDINCFMAWGSAVLDGPGKFYTSGMFADYPPGYMYVCGALTALARFMNLDYGSAGYVFLFKIPATVCDLVSAFVIYKLARRNGISKGFSLALAGVVAFNPALMFISGGWGQIDSILSLLLVLTIWLLNSEKKIAAGAVFGLAILLKPQALMAGPLIALIYIRDIVGPDWKKKLLNTVLAVLAALGVLFVLSLPFAGGQKWNWLIEKYFATANSYPYASIEAFNFPALIGGNWKSASATVLGLSFKTWGTFFIVLAVALTAYLYLKSYQKRNSGTPYLLLAFMIAMIFTFGHYMHERYLIPVLLLLLTAYIYYRDRRILLSFAVFTVSTCLNALAAMYIVDHQSMRGAYYSAVTVIGSLLTVGGFALLAYTVYDILLRGNALPLKKPSAAKRKEADYTAALSLDSAQLPKKFTKKDTLLISILTAVYAVVQLVNLGSLNVPETVYYGTQAGETVTVEFDSPHYVSEFWVYGNIGNDGTLLLRTDNGTEETYEQLYDNMFRWQIVPLEATAKSVEIMLYSGSVALNEIAFFDEDGALIPIASSDADGNTSALFDEQDTVPAAPSYLNGMYLDELYHGRTAYEHLHNLSPYENSHPPLGKIFIMLGIAVFGMNPFGWRIIGALFGIAMLPVFYALARRLLRSTGNAFLATALFAFDFMHFTQTRIATIDVYAVFFILVMYYFMYEYISMDYFAEGYKKSLKPLALSGVFFGVGAACKWICIYAGAGLAVLFFITLIRRAGEASRMKLAGTAQEKKRAESFRGEAVRTLLFCCVFFVAIPIVIYFASYIPYYIYEASASESYGFSDMVRTFWHYQDFMYTYHSTLVATHPYQSSWYQWPFTNVPMWYYYSGAGGKISTLSASGNPAVWWVCSIGAAALYALRALRRVKPDRALLLIGVGILANFLPWVLVPRCTFIYHFFATVPFIILATVYLVGLLEKKSPALHTAKWVWLGLAVLLFILLYPGISGLSVSAGWAKILKSLPGGKIMYGA